MEPHRRFERGGCVLELYYRGKELNREKKYKIYGPQGNLYYKGAPVSGPRRGQILILLSDVCDTIRIQKI